MIDSTRPDYSRLWLYELSLLLIWTCSIIIPQLSALGIYELNSAVTKKAKHFPQSLKIIFIFSVLVCHAKFCTFVFGPYRELNQDWDSMEVRCFECWISREPFNLNASKKISVSCIPQNGFLWWPSALINTSLTFLVDDHTFGLRCCYTRQCFVDSSLNGCNYCTAALWDKLQKACYSTQFLENLLQGCCNLFIK